MKKPEKAKAEKKAKEITDFKHNRQVLRALGLARAERAKAEQYAACGAGEIYLIWEKVERLCRAKAEEYK